MWFKILRISGIDIPDNKKIAFSLPHIYGIGRTTGLEVLRSANVDPGKKTSDLSKEEIGRIQNILDKNFKIGGDLRRAVSNNIKRAKEIGMWRGLRHSKKLPIHGRTKTNSRTTRGNVRRPMGSGRKPTAQKT